MSWNLRDTINNDNLNETHKIFGFNSIISKDGTKIRIHSKNGDPTTFTINHSTDIANVGYLYLFEYNNGNYDTNNYLWRFRYKLDEGDSLYGRISLYLQMVKL